MSFCDFLAQGWNAVWLAAAVGTLTAIIIEYWPAFQNIPDKWKQPIFAAMCLALAFSMWGGAGWQGCAGLPDWWLVLQAALEAGGLAFGAGTMIHRLVVALGLGYKPRGT